MSILDRSARDDRARSREQGETAGNAGARSAEAAGCDARSEVRGWRRFIAVLLGVTAALVLSAFAFVAIVDPYDNLAFSPGWKRHRVTTNERYAFPGLIRHGMFDSAVFGTSTVMLLKPEELDGMVGGRFANLAMSNASPWEQAQVMKFFAEHARAPPRTVMVGIDMNWCEPTKPLPRLTTHPFPPWEFDENPWNDYAHLLNTRALLHSMREMLMLAGVMQPDLRDDGYYRFTPDDDRYDPARARAGIYVGRWQAAESASPDAEPPAVGTRPANWTFPDLRLLEQALDRFPAQTKKILVFVPLHISMLLDPEEWEMFTHCKAAVVDIAKARSHVAVIDFMRPTTLTRSDGAYWDASHYRVGYATKIIEAIRSAFGEGRDSGPLFQVLWRPH
jgi:hypothetical protein